MPRLLVFTDLDGSLLDHHDYSWEAARPALERIRRSGVPLVFVTSKTRAEVEPLAAEMGLDEPFVTENGGGVFFPPRYAHLPLPGAREAGPLRVVVLGRPYEEVRRFVAGVRREGFPLRGFGDLTAAEVARLAGLSPEAAARARRREFTEPFLLDDPGRLDGLRDRAGAAGLAVARGGRFLHLMGAGQDKGEAVWIVHQAFTASAAPADAGRGRVHTVGLGDSPNDLPLLAAVDLPVVIPRPDGEVLEVPGRRPVVAPEPGSRGWNRVMLALLDRVEAGKIFQGGTSR